MKTNNYRLIARTAVLAVSAVFGMTSAFAKTTTFTQTAYSTTVFDFNDAANWNNGAPEPGDTVNIDVSGTGWNKWEILTGSMDIGSAGLTLNITKGNIRFEVVFSGSGKITKTGGGCLGVMSNSTFTGGTDLRSGSMEPMSSGRYFGTGAIDVYVTESAKPSFNTDGWGWDFNNDINVYGTLANTHTILSSGQEWTMGGTLYSEIDLAFYFDGTGDLTFSKAVSSASGRTLNLATHNTTRTQPNAPDYRFRSSVNASINMTSCYKLIFEEKAKGIGRDNKLTIAAGTCEFLKGTSWEGTNIVVSSANSTLTINDNHTLSREVTIDLATGAKLVLNNQANLVVNSLKIGGVELPEGGYCALSLPDAIAGNGAVVVKKHARTIIWKGGTSGNWNTAANWDPAEVPYEDTLVVLTNKVTFASKADPETVSVGPKGLSIEVCKDTGDVESYLVFTGTGPLAFIVFGQQWRQYSASPAFSGGIEIHGNCYLYSTAQGANSLGTGRISIYGGANGIANGPQLYPDRWGLTLPNEIYVYGPITNTAGMDRGRAGAITTGGELTLTGNIVADSDLLISEAYGRMTIKGSVTVPNGKEIRLYNLNNASRDKDGDPFIVCQGELHGQVVAIANATRPLVIDAAMTNENSSLTSLANTNLIFNAGAFWAGTNVTVRGGTSAKMMLKAVTNLKPYTVLSLADGATADLDYSGRADIAELWIDGVKQEPGTYNAARLPSRFSGTGQLRIPGPRGTLILLR